MKKEHVSFSEIHKYSQCQYRHNLNYILENEEPKTVHLIFGNAVHDAIDAVKKGEAKIPWLTMGKTIYKWIKEHPVNTYTNYKGETVIMALDPKEWTKQAFGIFNQIFDWLDENFPNYELIGSEIKLYEPISEIEGLKFKGFIDLFIKIDDVYHLIDFKTTGWGWDRKKRSDTYKQYQLTLYKNFLCQKMNIDPKLVKTHFLLLKRQPPKSTGNRIELITVTSGPKKMSNANEWMVKHAKFLKRGLKLKNRTGCLFCPWHHTKLCP
jgi:ATP-dependent helicase/DNAse subunit B